MPGRARSPIVDADVHPVVDSRRMVEFLTEPWRSRYLGGGRGPGTLGYWNPNGVMRADAVTPEGQRIEGSVETLGRYYLDEYHIDYAVLNPGNTQHIALAPDPDFSQALISASNDVFVNDWLPRDPRLRLSLSVNAVDPELAAREIHRLGDHPGIAQVLLPSGARIPYGQRFWHPIYAAAAEHHLPVAIHPGSEGVGVSGAPTAAGYPTNYLEWHTGLVGSYMAHLISLVSEGVFQKFPTLRYVLIEGGAMWLPPLLWRFDKNWKALRITTPWLDRPPSEVVRDHILLTTQPIEEPERPGHFHHMLEMHDFSHNLMFSSDFPHWDGDTPDFAARAFPPGLRERVMYETAAEFYHLPVATEPQVPVAVAAGA